MKIHPRTLIVQAASLDIAQAIIKAVEQHGLTAAETVGIMHEQASSYHKYVLRVERHGHEGKKADEA